MRIDGIDLDGIIKIQGITGGANNQLVSINQDNVVSWGTSSGTVGDIVVNSTLNTIIVESVYADPQTSGQRLLDAYQKAVVLVSEISASIDNRVTLLMMPGDYDLQSQLTIDTSFIDIVGLSTNPLSCVIRTSILDYPIIYNGVDSKLSNIYLKSNRLAIKQIGICYLRWDNIIIDGNGLTDNVEYSCDKLIGEFTNMVVKNGTNFAVAENEIDGIFENIYFETGTNFAFYSYNGKSISGTFSDIKFDLVNVGVFYGSGFGYEISGKFSKIIVTQTQGDVFYSLGNLSGDFSDIEINVSSAPPKLFYADQYVNGFFKNIKIDTQVASQIFISSLGEINGSFENLEFYSDSNDSIFSAPKIIGTFSKIGFFDNPTSNIFTGNEMNLYMDDLYVLNCANLFYSSGSLTFSGTYRNFDIGTVDYFFNNLEGDITGNYENIKVDNCRYNTFYSSNGAIDANFERIQILTAESSSFHFRSGKYLTGNFQEIVITNPTSQYTFNIGGVFKSLDSLSGNFKDIFVSNCAEVFSASRTMSCNLYNLYFGDSVQIGDHLISGDSLMGNYKNIYVDKVVNSLFTSNYGGLDITAENIVTQKVTNIFKSELSLTGKYRNIKIGLNDLSVEQVIAGDIFRSVTDKIDGTFDEITIGNGDTTNNVFQSNLSISGTFSNLIIGSTFAYVFNAANGTGGFGGYYKDIFIKEQANQIAFYGYSFSNNTIFDNVKNYNKLYAGFSGKMFNCDLNYKDNETGSLKVYSTTGAEIVLENNDISYRMRDDIGEIFLYSVASLSGNLINSQVLYNINEYGLATSSINVGGFPTSTNMGIQSLSQSSNPVTANFSNKPF